jgi:5-(carboxyamino)imidazole ribonucleotide synthase
MAILPPATIGIIGGGQLGRMFVTAARTMGYEVIVLEPDPHSPAGSMATEHVAKPYDDLAALDYLAQNCAVVTTEFENIPVIALEHLAQHCAVFPSADALSITQNRIREKSFIQSLGLLTSPFISVETAADLDDLSLMRFPAILKTATLGYDGKGQVVCENAEQVRSAFSKIGVACVLEQKIELEREVSVVLARSQRGETFCFPLAQNEHVNGILDVSIAPAEVSDTLRDAAFLAAQKIARGLNYCGVLAVELFVSTDGDLLVNEIAPRPHNSGHFTLDACFTSQFEQQLRMICDLPSGNCNLHTPVAMLNLLGDVWPQPSVQPAWDEVLEIDRACLHLYGKKEARSGRKMGHINFLGDEVASALAHLQQARSILTR